MVGIGSNRAWAFCSGAVMSAPRRVQLLHWARRHGAWVIEDDYDRDYHYDHQPIASLHGLDHDRRVLATTTCGGFLGPDIVPIQR